MRRRRTDRSGLAYSTLWVAGYLSLLLVSPAFGQISGQQVRQRYDKATKGANLDDFVKRLNSDDADKRLEAVKSLRDSKDSKSIEYLIQALGDPDVRVQAKAVSALGDVRATEATPVLIQYLSRRTVDANLKRLILASLGKIGDPRAAQPIVEFLQRDLDPAMRGTAIFALGEIGAPESTATLERIAANDTDATVSRLAGEALAKVKHHQAHLEKEVTAPSKTFLEPKGPPPR